MVIVVLAFSAVCGRAVNFCISDWQTNCTVEGSATLGGPAWNPVAPVWTLLGYQVCASNQLGVTVSVTTNRGGLTVTDTNGCEPGYSFYVKPVIVSRWWTMERPGQFTNTGDMSAAITTPTNPGPCTLTFYLYYTNSSPCLDAHTNTVAIPLDVMDGSRTNAVTCTPATVKNVHTYPSKMACIGEAVAPPAPDVQLNPGQWSASEWICPGPRMSNVVREVQYTLGNSYWVPTFPSNGFPANGDYTFGLYVVANPPSDRTNDCSGAVLNAATITYLVRDTTTNFDCVSGPSLAAGGAIGPATNNVCVGESAAVPTADGFSLVDGVVRTIIKNCPTGETQTSAGPAGYTLGTAYCEPTFPGVFSHVGTYPFTLKAVATPAGDSPCKPVTLTLGTAIIIVTSDKKTNVTCYGGGSLTSAGTLSKSNETTCVGGSPISFPTLSGAAYSSGTVRRQIIVCGDPNNPASSVTDTPVTYSVFNFWSPRRSTTFTNAGTYTFTSIIVGQPSSSLCPALTNPGPSFTVTVNPALVTNTSCASVGQLVNPGTLEFNHAITFPGYTVTFPKFENAAFGPGLVWRGWTTCESTVVQTSTVPMNYSTTWFWSPPQPTAPYTAPGAFSYTPQVVGTPADPSICSIVTNSGPTFSVAVIKVDASTGVPEADEDVAGDPARPGKIIMVNSGDADHDGIPNYADFAATNGAGFGTEVPLSLQIPYAEGRTNFRVKFTYPESDPAAITVTANTPTLPAGKFRLWRPHAANSRLTASAPAGDYLKPGQTYSIQDLGFTDNTVTGVVFYAEAVQVSSAPADIRLKIEIDPDGNGPMSFLEADAVRFTALDVNLMEATGESSTAKRVALKDSDPSPVITVSQCSMSNVRASATGNSVLADLTVSGTVRAAVCDVTPGERGIITNVFIHLNSYETPLDVHGVPTIVSKGTNLSSFTKPYPFTGTFSKTYTGVEVDSGVNLVRITASDGVVGNTGFVELTCEVKATDLATPWVDYSLLSYANVDVTLDFGGIHSLAELTAGNAVTLTCGAMVSTNPAFASTLHRVSAAGQSPVVLASQGTNNIAWVVIPSASELDQALHVDIAGSITASVSAPAIIPPNTLFTLGETATNSSAFGHDRITATLTLVGQPTSNSVNQLNAVLTRSGFGSQTATLTETETNSFLFQNSAGSIQLQLSDADFSSTNHDLVGVGVTSTALHLTGHGANTIETGTNTLQFVTWEPFNFYSEWSSSSGWNFGWLFEVGAFTQIARSEGGELHLHFLQFQGPADVLAVLSQQPGSTIIPGADGRYYFKRPGENRPADYATAAAGDGAWFGLSDGSGAFLLGFTKGFGGGGVRMIKGTVNAIVAAEEWYLNIVFGTDEQQVAAYNSSATFVRETAETVKVLANFVIKVNEDQDAFIGAALNGQWEDANKIAAPYQMAVEYSSEFVKEAWGEYLGPGTTDFQRGEIFGGIMFEVAALAAPYCKAGEAAQVGKLEFLCQLRNAGFYQRFPKAAAALERTIQSLQAFVKVGCFTAGTPIHTGQGLKNIEEIHVGDLVLTRDPVSGQQNYQPVTRIFVNQTDRLYHLQYRVVAEIKADELEAAHGEIVCTGNHPFFVPSAGRFIPMSELEVGTDLSLANGRRAEVVAIEVETAPSEHLFTTFNFEVADFHTYFAGELGVWVHNDCELDRLITRYVSVLRRKIIGGGVKPNVAIEAALTKDIVGSGEKLCKFFKGATDELGHMCARGEIPASDLVTYSDWKRIVTPRASGHIRELFGEGMLGKAPYHGHHGVCKFWTDALNKMSGKTWTSWAENDVPVFVLDSGAHLKPGGIHGIFDSLGIGERGIKKFTRADQIPQFLTAVKRAYTDAGRPEVGEAIIKWFAEHGVR